MTLYRCHSGARRGREPGTHERNRSPVLFDRRHAPIEVRGHGFRTPALRAVSGMAK
jgi:hypothetical protein